MTTLLDAALKLANRGLHVYPLRQGTKDGQHLKSWKREATTDADRIRQWWAAWPGANIGLHCGLSGLVVVDLDVKNGADGLGVWAALCSEHGINVQTVTVTTPSGGEHRYYQANGANLGSTAGRLGPGIDTRAGAGYVLAPPSTTDQGHYTWGGRSEIADLPHVLHDLLTKPTKSRQSGLPGASRDDRDLSLYVQRAFDAEIARVRAAPEGTRNATLNAAAFSIGQLVGAAWARLDRTTAESELLSAALACGLEEHESLATRRSGLDAGIADPRPGPADHRQVAGRAVTSNLPQKSEAKTETPEPSPQDEQAYLLYEKADDEGNAQCLDRLHRGQFLHCNAYSWLVYNGQFWKRESAEARLDRAIVDTLRARRRAAVDADREKLVDATKANAYRVTGCKKLYASIVSTSVADFDDHPDLLNCQNGVLDLRTGQMVTHEPGQRFTYCIPVDYDPNASQETWENFITDAIHKPGTDGRAIGTLREFLQKAAGYSITGRTQEECLFYVFGPTRSGKGTYTETMLAMLGKPMSTNVDFTTFTATRDHDTQNFDLAPLKPCRFISASESKRYRQLNAAKIKQITGGDDIRCAFKRQTHFTYRPQFKIWLASNHPVNADVDDDAVWYRLHVIEFPNSHAGNEDKSLKLRMKEPDILRGVLSWAVEGAIAWYASGKLGLIAPKPVTDATQQARRDLDFVQQWLDERIKKTDSQDHFLPNKRLYDSYHSWCSENGVTPYKLRSLTRALRAKDYKAGKRKFYEGTVKRGCLGIQFRADESLHDT